MKSGPENSKEFVELNFQVKYTDDEDKPVAAQVDIPISQSTQPAESSSDGPLGGKLDIYDEEQAVFIAPMFIVHRGLQRSLSLKISLQSFLERAVDPCKAQLSLLFRQFNKQLFLSNLKTLLKAKRLSLSQISKIFVKIN